MDSAGRWYSSTSGCCLPSSTTACHIVSRSNNRPAVALAIVQFVVAAELRLELRMADPATRFREARERGQSADVLAVEDGAQVHRDSRGQQAVDPFGDAVERSLPPLSGRRALCSVGWPVERDLHLAHRGGLQQRQVVHQRIAVRHHGEAEGTRVESLDDVGDLRLVAWGAVARRRTA